MRGLPLAGALWIIAGLSCAGLFFFVFVLENLNNLGALLEKPILVAIVAVGAIVGLAVGVLLIARPGPDAVRWSNIAGVIWMACFGALAMTRLGGNIGPLFSSTWITVFGVAGALVAYWRRGSAST